MDKINEELARIIYNYSSNHKIVDEAFCDKIISLLARRFELHEYIRGTIYNCGDKTEVASYDPVLRKIKIRLEYFSNNLLKNYDLSDFDNDIFNYYYFINYYALVTLTHEVTHARQFKMVYNDQENSLESTLYRVSSFNGYDFLRDVIKYDDESRESSIEYDPFYFDIYSKDRVYYYSLPSERIANITGAKCGKEVTDIISKNQFLNNIADRNLKRHLFVGYVDYCPSAYVLAVNEVHKNFGKYQSSAEILDKWENLLYNAYQLDYSFEKRLLYGLPLTNEEKITYEYEINKSKNYLLKQIQFSKKAN